MFNFFDINFVILIKSKNIQALDIKTNQIINLEFNDTIVKNLEIFSLENYETLIKQFLEENNIKNKRMLILLSDEIIFKKTLEIANTQNDINIADTFYEEIPLDPKKLQKINIVNNTEITLIGTNKELYENIVTNALKNKNKISGILPYYLFGILDENLTIENFSIIKTQWKNFKKFSISNEIKSTTETKTVEKPTNKKNKKLLVLVLVFVSMQIILFTVLYKNNYLDFLKKRTIKTPGSKQVLENNNQNNINPKESSESIDTRKEKPELNEDVNIEDQNIVKAGLTMTILNGSQISGEAKRFADIFINLNYKNIKTGNANKSPVPKTIVEFSEKVPNQIQIEIIEALKKESKEPDVTTTPAPEDNVDITIILGVF